MNPWQIAWRNLKRRKLRTFLTMLSIVIGVASTFAVISSVETAKKTFPLYLQQAFGKADFQISGTDAYFPEETFRSFERINGTASVSALKQNTKLLLNREGVSAIQKRVDLTGYSRLDTALTGFKVVEGSLTQGAVITDRTAGVWKARVGDTISFDTDKGVREIRISAIVKYTVELMGPSSWMMAKYHPWSVAIPLPVLQDWFGLSGKIQGIQVKALPGTDKAALEGQLDKLVKGVGNVYMQPILIDYDSLDEADTFFIALYLAGFLGIALSAFIIFNSMYVGIKERKNEFAALKTIGYTPEQLRSFVLLEVVLLSVIGTAAGLLFGYGLAHLLKMLIFLVFGADDEGGMSLGQGFAISVGAGLLMPVAAALYPIRQAGKISVIEAFKETRNAPKSRGKWLGIVGVLLIASAFFINHLLLVAPLMLGIVHVFPYLFRGAVILLRPAYRKLFAFSGQIAASNLNRNRTRAAMTSIILCMGIAMIVLMSSLNSALVQSFERVIYSSYGGNLDIHLHHIEKTDLEQLKQVEGVADAQTYPTYSAIWNLDGSKRKLPVYGIGAEWIDRFPLFSVSDRTPGELVRGLKKDEIVLDKMAFKAWGGEIGGTIELATLQGTQSFRVVYVVESMKNGGYGAFLPTDRFKEAFGLKYERNALILKDENTSPVQLRENIFDRFGGRIEEMFGPEDWVSVMSATYTGSFAIIDFLVILSILISGIGIANTLLINIMERVRELGMMRAVGVTRRQVNRMVLLEGLGMGTAATVIGCAFGITLVYLTSTFMEIRSLTYRFGVPWTIIAIIALFGLAVSLIASFAPASRASKTRLSEALRYE